MKALDTQVGGNHYKNMKVQPVQLFAKTRCTAFQANIWKYITRYKYKDGAEDIKKCMHYAELAKELNCHGRLCTLALLAVTQFCEVNSLSEHITSVVEAAAFDRYDAVIELCKDILHEEYPEEQ